MEKTIKKVCFLTLGCKLNYSETSEICEQFLNKNTFKKVSLNDNPDIIVINTCSVTHVADSKSRQLINKAKKNNPNSIIIVTGCYAQLSPEEISSLGNIQIVLGNDEKFSILDIIDNIQLNKDVKLIKVSDIVNSRDFNISASYSGRTRSFLKIQDGCDYYCSYCTVPYARGVSRSAQIKEVIDKMKYIYDKGFKEIVLTGINLGDFGRKNGENFYNLLVNIDKTFKGYRVRLSSIEPDLLHDEIIHLVSESKVLLPHFHIPLQSASDYILRLMERRYNLAFFDKKISLIKKLIPHCCIAVDVIVGFPSETEKYFLETLNYLENSKISYLHVFSYSERKLAKASKYSDKVTEKIKKERSKLLHEVSDKLKKEFYLSEKGNVRNTLFEGKISNNYIYGFTDNYIKVRTTYNSKLINNVVSIKLRDFNEFEQYYDVEIV